MDALSQLSCRVANKVALSMLYRESTSASIPARRMVEEAITATCDLLDRINPSELRDWFEQFQTVYLSFQSELIDDPVVWSQFLGSQCDLLHEVKLHQKTIANLGDDLAKWNRFPVAFDEFGDGLDGLAGLISDHAVVFVGAIENEAGRETKLKRRSELFTNSVCGLTIVLVAINQAINIGDPRDKYCASLATFGASLTNASVQQLYRACQLSWA